MTITLKTLPNATAQEVFDQVSEHLISQNMKSKNGENGLCMYRFNDLKCAAGCLISDEEYDPSMEQNTWCELIIQKYVPENHGDLIIKLQGIHDSFKVEEWPRLLNKLKNEIGLD